MKSRELLELAAKAAGIEGVYDADLDGIVMKDCEWTPSVWRPHTCRDDALRLVVKLKMGICFETQFQIDSWVSVVEVYHSHDGEGGCHCVVEPLDNDPDVAVRRAIVRAAAEIGRGME